MKKALYFLMAAIALAACQNGDFHIEEKGNGYLVINGISLSTTTENVARSAVSHNNTSRNISNDEANEWYEVEIYNAENEKIDISTLRLGTTFAMPVGNYTIIVKSTNYNVAYGENELGEPKYYHSSTFTIESEQITKLTDVKLAMANFGVTYTLPETSWIKESTLNIGYAGTTKVIKNGETAYFDLATDNDVNGKPTYQLTLTNIANEVQTQELQTLNATPEAGKVYNIEYNIQ